MRTVGGQGLREQLAVASQNLDARGAGAPSPTDVEAVHSEHTHFAPKHIAYQHQQEQGNDEGFVEVPSSGGGGRYHPYARQELHVGRDARDARADRLENMLEQLLERDLAKAQPPLQRPLLAAVCGALQQFGAVVKPMIRAVRLADRAQTDEAVAALLLPLAQKALEQPSLGDDALFHAAASSAAFMPALHGGLVGFSPVGSVAVPAVGSYGRGGGNVSRGAHSPPFVGRDDPCFRCGHRGHRNQQCNALMDRDGQPIPARQLVKFAPQAWKDRWGYDADGVKVAGR